jgi:peptidoglycan/xylan/chitin deacetylase (PgdA/CDA1 family)
MEIVARTCRPGTLDDLTAGLKGAGPLPAKTVVVTFDDGYVDNYELALPVLNHYGIPATFYVTAGHIDSAAAPWYMRLRHAFMRTTKRSWSWPERPADIIPLTTALERRAAFAYATRRCVRLKTRSRECLVVRIEQELGTTTGLRGSDYLMSWPQLRSLVSQGHTVGSHTLTHPNMALLDPEDCGSELTGSKKILDERLPLPVRHFSYPNPALSPEWNHGTTALTRRAGYETAVINTQGNIGTTVDRFALKRLSVPEDPREFESKLSLAMLGVAV